MSVTVGIPVYNEEKNIKRLLYSLISQNIKTKSIIVVNDGSTDRTSEIIREVKNEISSTLDFHVIDLGENKGKANALNLIFKYAQSDYLILLDSDTYFLKNDTLKHLLECFTVESNVGLICGWYKFEDLKPYDIIDRAYRFSSNLLESIARTLNNLYGATGAIIALPKDVYKNLILPENIIRDDTYIYLYVLSLGKRFVFCPNAKVAIFLYNKGSLKGFIYKQIKSRNIPKQDLDRFRVLAKMEFEQPNSKILLNVFFHCFVKYPIDGIIWIVLKVISYIYRKLYSHADISYKWRKAGF